MKILNKLLFGGALSCASVLNAQLFEFPENSTLTQDQQNTLKLLFIKSSGEGIKTLATSFISGTLTDIVKDYLQSASHNSQSLHSLILPYLLNTSHKDQDLQAVLKSSRIGNLLEDTEGSYIEAIKGEEDGLFNGIIRETLKAFKTFILTDSQNDTEQLTEAFNVLWNAISSRDAVLDVSAEFLQQIEQNYPKIPVRSLLEKLNEKNGKNLCEKIADLLASFLQDKIATSMDSNSCCSSCCSCFQTTLGIAKDVAITIIPFIPEILKLVITIITLV